MGRYFDEMSAVIERHGGTVEKFIGDAVMAVFGIPRLHEDDAVRAVRAAAGMREALEALNLELEREHGVGIAARIGVNTGEVVAGDPSAGQRLVTGDAVNVAARLEQAASPGEIFLGETTYRLVKDAVEVEPVAALDLKGKEQPVPAYRLVAVLADVAGHVRHLDSPMVGRGKELAMLERALERAVTERTSHLFTLLGSAGVGKSRLVSEFLEGPVGDSDGPPRSVSLLRRGDHVLPARRGDPPGGRHPRGGAAGRLAIEARSACSTETPDGERIASLVGGLFGWAPPGATEDAFWAVRKILEHLARERPVVVVFDDIHWAEPTMLDLIEHLADWTRDAAVLLVCVARPELLEIRSGWGGGKMNATSILLEPLPGDEASMLVDNLLGEADIPRARARPDPRCRRREPAVRRGDARDADRRRAPPIRGGLVAIRRGPRERDRPTHDPSPARSTARSPGRGGARGDRTWRGRGQGVPHRRRHDAQPGLGEAERPLTPARAGAEGADPARSCRVRGGRCVPVPPPADP